MQTFRTGGRGHKWWRIVAWALFCVGGVILLPVCLGEYDKADPVFGLLIWGFAYVIDFAVTHTWMASISEEGLTFERFRTKFEHYQHWRKILFWNRITEIRRYYREPGTDYHGTTRHFAYFITVDQVVLIEDHTDGWLFSREFDEFWPAVFEQAKIRGIAVRLMATIEDHPRDFPEGLHVRTLGTYYEHTNVE